MHVLYVKYIYKLYYDCGAISLVNMKVSLMGIVICVYIALFHKFYEYDENYVECIYCELWCFELNWMGVGKF